ncbi:MAG TPA: hypothetical protein PJ986_17205 [Gammaproteobacteria bacterium]|nr:hypothetical protein [Gammaproteobacteria bacterium]
MLTQRRMMLSAVLTLSAWLTAGAAGAANLSETTIGDFSGDGLAPTQWQLELGINTLDYTVQGAPRDLDYLRVDLPAGSVLKRIVLTGYEGGDTRGFIGVMDGPRFTVPANQAVIRVGEIRGYALFGTAADAAHVGDDLLPLMATADWALGFEGPLGAASYTFWFDQLGPSNYVTLAFDVAPVPLPGAAALFASAACAGGWVGRKRARG